MDAVGFEILRRELEADGAVLAEAARRARQRIEERGPGHLEACAFELGRFYNVLEKMLERICEGFENHFERRGDYHEKLLQRLAIGLPGLRPAFIPAGALADLRELKGFRHVVRHAYDLTLRETRVREIAEIAEKVAQALPAWHAAFAAEVRREQGWDAPGAGEK